MKLRILSCFLIFALCFSMLSACGSDTAPSDHSPSSSLQTEISDSQDSTPVESSETDPAGTSDDDSSEGEAEPSQVVEPATPPDQQAESSAPAEITTASRFSTSDVPAYSGKAYTSVNGNVPYFSAAELTTQSFETYSDLDSLGRCGVTYACIGKDLMPTEERGFIGMVKPTGWHTVRYDDLVDGKYLYNRCHLIGYQLTGENANTKNLITGTRYLNIEGMLPFENMVADYIQETNNHVLYRVTPIFEGRRPCRELRTSEAPSTPPSVHLCWQQHLSGKKDWTSITTAEKSCTGICHQTQLIWSNGKAGSTVISAMRSVRTWQTANSELSHLKRAFGRRPWIVRQWP